MKTLTNQPETYIIVAMKIERSTDFSLISSQLRTDLSSLSYNPDLKKMLKNIEKMVDELSRKEVDARRKQKYSHLEDDVNRINSAIDHLEKLILIAKLMQ